MVVGCSQFLCVQCENIQELNTRQKNLENIVENGRKDNMRIDILRRKELVFDEHLEIPEIEHHYVFLT